MIHIIIGVIFEVYWAWGLKHITKDFWGILSIATALLISFYCFICACKKMEVSIAYAIYTGLGSLGLVMIDMFSMGLNPYKLILMASLLLGIIGIKLTEGKK